jgi:hypothetical protein
MSPPRRSTHGLQAVQRPSDLAALVRSYLLEGPNWHRAAPKELPSLQILTQLFDVLFYLSIQTEEGHQIACSAAFMPPAPAARVIRSKALHVEVSAAESVRFQRSLPCDPRTLRKLAQAVDPSCAALGIYPKGDRLEVWGIVDQAPLHLERFTSWESTAQAFAPGLFYTQITGPGEVTVYIRDRVFAVLRQSRLISRERDALWKGPLSILLNPYIRRFQRDVKRAVGDTLYRSAGKWFEGTDELWRCSDDFGDELRNEWLGALCRVLLKIRNYRHGGAVIICGQKPTGDLSIKYPLTYNRITDALKVFAAAHIRQQRIETEARQGRLHLLEFEGRQVAKFGYFTTPDARENIFMQGISLPEHDVLFRSWHYLALRADARAALAGAVGLVASLSRIDGAVLLRNGLNAAGFGVEIRTQADVRRVYLAEDEFATSLVPVDPRAFGTRHRSMMRYCQFHPSAVGLVISQDGDIRAITTVASKLVMWEQLQLRAGTLDEYLFPPQMQKRTARGTNEES